ncbi:phospholipase D-like domain-containing protein [Acidithiobacillus caldus]|uniref:phospholipase D n=2 Tax=Acidithiobacillus caldus TaxID=33059 RepID=A0A1E7YNQ3_9PROT|nr:phospholipase D-like domain-containing protein [Acidithiobacillus caldus]OFC35543.1 GTP-binding protein [Acidithiobacillus caldus]OFC36392.1 GTP-binding protein [Acidithiobacillus caldus]OFC40458.1 GTP-binding protein [Acidithiobacillus caldus]
MIYIEPQAGTAPIVQIIDQSKKEINLEVYFLSDSKILHALAAAKARGVRVRIILDKKPDGISAWKVEQEKHRALATGAQFRWAPKRFTSNHRYWQFMHAKYLCNLHECEIGSANFGWDDFHRNRDYLFTTHNPHIVEAANAVFRADWTNTHAPAYVHHYLVLSPRHSAADLERVIEQPGPVDIESEEMGPYRPILKAIARKGAQARVILPANIDRTDQRDVQYLREHGVRVHLMPVRPIYMHAKMMVGSSLGFIGSENFTETSLNWNREMGVLIHRPESLAKLRSQFEKDWEDSQS